MDAKQRFTELLRGQFNLGVNYEGRRLKLDTVIEQKVLELSRLLVGRSSKIDFSEPSPSLERFDSKELRERIKSLTAEEVKNAGINKSTLYTLRQHARNERSFRLYGKVNRKLQSLTT